MTRPRVVLHVGLPKTGTTFLQSSLRRNRKALKAAGVRYPVGNEADDRMFLAALDVRGTRKAWGRSRTEVDGSWDLLCRKARAFDGTTVISHELLAGASVHRIVAAMTMLKGLEVHVVVTARDPARQAVAEWQEGIKHGRRLTFEEFRTHVLASDAESDHARRFRAAQDLPGVLARWSTNVPAERVHLVTVPPPSDAPWVLWERFAGVVGFDASAFAPVGLEGANPSLGADQVDLLRRVNIALEERLVQPAYGAVVKHLYAQDVLGRHDGTPPVAPPQVYDDLGVVAERWVKEIDRAGYPVHGDVDDLVPRVPPGTSRHPDATDPAPAVPQALGSAPCSPRCWWPTAARSRSGRSALPTSSARRPSRSSRTRTGAPSTA